MFQAIIESGGLDLFALGFVSGFLAALLVIVHLFRRYAVVPPSK